jgi:hypothetical protein
MADFRDPMRRRVRVNRLLDSPDLSVQAMRFLLWHEYLHVHLCAPHTPQFRRMEHLWPGHEKCDAELRGYRTHLGVQYW